MKKINQLSKNICLGLGVLSILGTSIPAFAEGESNKALTDAIIVKEFTTPKDGDKENLNVGWTSGDLGNYYCKDENRIKSSGWEKIGANWYFFDKKDFTMQTGWLKDNGVWYYLTDYSDVDKNTMNKELGTMKTGWLQKQGKWYFLNNNGAMVSKCWMQINGTWYYFYGDGSMAANTTIGGYYVNSSGAWVK